MALFFRNLTLFTSGRLIFGNTNRVLQPQVAGLKSVSDKLKEANIPEKPKKPLTAYFRFVQEQRANIVKDNPNLKLTEIAKACAKKWKEIEPNAKERYLLQYRADMDEYAKKALEYEAKLTTKQREQISAINKESRDKRKRRRLNKVLRENNKPKRPYGAYVFYLMEQAKLTRKSIKDLLPLMKGKWAELSDSEKQKYLDEAKQAKELYEEEMAKWEKQMIKEGKTNIVRNKTLQEVKPKLKSSKSE